MRVREGDLFGLGQYPGWAEIMEAAKRAPKPAADQAGYRRLQIGGPFTILDANNKPIAYDVHLELFEKPEVKRDDFAIEQFKKIGDYKWKMPAGQTFEKYVEGDFPETVSAHLSFSAPGTMSHTLIDDEAICRRFPKTGVITAEKRMCPRTIHVLKYGEKAPAPPKDPWDILVKPKPKNGEPLPIAPMGRTEGILIGLAIVGGLGALVYFLTRK